MDFEAYYNAAIPVPATVLGYRLRPFSLGHYLLLNRIQSPFISGCVDQVDIGTFAFSVLICSMTYREGVELLSDSKLPSFLKKWGSILRRKRKKMDLTEKAALFLEYIEDGMSGPDYKWKENQCEKVEAPTCQIIKVELMSKLGMSEEEILDRPWALCLWDFITHRAMEGQVQFIEADVYEDAVRMANRLTEKLNRKNNGQKTQA